MLGTDESRCFGYDISETACTKARIDWPNFEFTLLDLTAPSATKFRPKTSDPEGHRLFVIRATLWCVFPKLHAVIDVIRGLMSDGDQLMVIQNFPPLDSSFVGKDVIPDHIALLKHFSVAFSPVRHMWFQDTLKSTNDNWFIGLFSTKDK